MPTLPGFEQIPAASARALAQNTQHAATRLGPATPVRSITDGHVVPLLHTLGFHIRDRIDEPGRCWLRLAGDTGPTLATAFVVTWNEPLSSAWRHAIHGGISADSRWILCANGTTLRLVDSRQTWSREYLEFDVATLAESAEAQSLLWSLVRSDALAAPSPLLDRAVVLSARHGVDVCVALGSGVLDALRLLISALAPRAGRRFTPDTLFEHSLTVVYRILFLLFAEARGLLPLWHPLYRDRYSIESIVTVLVARRPPRGLWRALQAISRLAHAGCSAAEFAVTAFNGRLFAPAHASAFDHARIDDDTLGRALVAVGTTAVGRAGQRARVAYRDLDVEQLGAVYERVLDYQPARTGRSIDLVRTGEVRKSTGSFYTPRSVAGYLVRKTLGPLIAGRSADEILQLRVLDPAMGSGAFLVAACRYLASAAELALVRDGEWQPHDVTGADRTMLRRQIASRCLFGVDLNPTAVQLARLSLWLATLSANKPLSFLDHHLVVGNSLVGASPADVHRPPARPGGRRQDANVLPLFDETDLTATLAGGAAIRQKLALDVDDSAAIVRDKERRLAEVSTPASPLGRWSRLLDLWCAIWFWERGAAPDHKLFPELAAHILGEAQVLPDRIATPMLDHSAKVAEERRFLHWPLAFPEVFSGDRGQIESDGGFDAVIGNPPWDMVRGDSGEGATRAGRRSEAQRLTGFVRESGIYARDALGHSNLYQLFVERALHVVRRNGRIGFVLPSGIASDAGAAPLRRLLFHRAAVDDITGLDNRERIFPIHRSTRFVLLTCSAGTPTSSIRCRFGITTPEALERATEEPDSVVTLSRALIARLSGPDDLGIPEVGGSRDVQLLERISARFPRLEESTGWSARFGRELNASDDRGRFEDYVSGHTARPVIEGKQIDPFRVSVDRSRYQLTTGARDRVPRRARLAYRDIASATNRLTMIAAMIPARAVTTHTLFCLKTPLPLDAQHVLCGLMNSYVANYLVRFRVNTHVTVSLVSRLPMPPLSPDDPAFDEVLRLVRVLLHGTMPAEQMDEYARLQALVARLYGLSRDDFEHVLSTFPLVPAEVKRRAHGFL